MASTYRPYTQTEHRSPFNLTNQATRSPETSGPALADGRPVMEVPRPYGESFHGIQALGPSPSLNASAEERYPPPFGLVKFYTDRDGPWHPLSKSISESRSDESRGRAQLPFDPSFTNFREPVPSDCDTIGPGVLMSDSGYGSQPKASVGIPSQYGGDIDRNIETQSIIGHFSDIQLDHGLRKEHWNQHSATRSQSGTELLVCPDCKKTVKNKSELTKHTNRHTKPFICDVQGCRRKEGFSTKNDLSRHQESVHNADGAKYSCNINSCKNKTKLWPRADNFRQHLKRVHHRVVFADVEELTSFLYTPPPQEETDRNCVPAISTGLTDNVMPSSNWAGMEARPEDAMIFGDMSSPGHIDRHENNTQFSSDDPVLEGANFGLGSGADDQDEDHSESSDAMPEDDLQFEHMLSSIGDAATQSRDSRSPSSEEITTKDISCIRPDVLSHTSFSQGLQDGSDDRPKVLELVSEGSGVSSPASYEQDFGKNDPIAELSFEPYLEKQQIDTNTTNSRLPNDIIQGKRSPALSVHLRSPEAKPLCLDNDSNAGDSPSAELKSSTHVLENVNLDDDIKTSTILQALLEKGLLDKYMGKFGYQKAKESPVKPKKPTVSSTPANENQVQCTQCTKAFNRKCELKKHMKRHARPYGCTFAGCTKRFGSKNDWKRHENSQHFQLEMWKCGEMAKDSSAPCGRACHRRETFKHHLLKDHGIKDSKIIEQKLEKCLLGRNCEARFWCGFCEQKIEIKQKGGPAWTERFDHIDAHFSGKDTVKKDIKEWKSVDPDLPEMEDCTSSSDGGSRPDSPEPNGADLGHKSSAMAGRPGGSKKRARDDSDSDDRRLKRPKDGTIWICCSCKYQNSLAANDICLDCNHFCDGCEVE